MYSPGVDPALIGPFRPAAYLTSYAYLALPNAFVGPAIQFSLAAQSGRPIAGYLGSLLLVFLTIFVATILVVMRGPGRLLDFIGVHFILSDLSHLWTSYERAGGSFRWRARYLRTASFGSASVSGSCHLLRALSLRPPNGAYLVEALVAACRGSRCRLHCHLQQAVAAPPGRGPY